MYSACVYIEGIYMITCINVSYCCLCPAVTDWKKGHRLEHKEDKGAGPTSIEEDVTG